MFTPRELTHILIMRYDNVGQLNLEIVRYAGKWAWSYCEFVWSIMRYDNVGQLNLEILRYAGKWAWSYCECVWSRLTCPSLNLKYTFYYHIFVESFIFKHKNN